MIRLQVLGDAAIHVAGKEIKPTTPLVFAGLLYLGMERGRRIPRGTLMPLWFPDADERSAGHSLRQLLYKLKQLGAPVEADNAVVTLPASEVEDPFLAIDQAASDPEALNRLSLGFAPGYHPGLSKEFDRWLDEQRGAAANRIRSVLVAELDRCRHSGNHDALLRAAAALIRIDPLNEAATLGHAEGLALSGQKRDAIRVLEEYSAEVGRTAADIKLPADILKRRIADRFRQGERSALPLVGRAEELSLLLAQFARAAAGAPTVSVVWGDAGVGKTRLVQEFAAHLHLKSARVESAHTQPRDVDRPLGAFIDLVPKLLDARGALAIAPQSLETLRRFSGDVSAGDDVRGSPDLMTARIRQAVSELLACIAAEGPLVLVVEDAHWLDQSSLRLLLASVLDNRARVHLVLTQRGTPRVPEGIHTTENVFMRRLDPLGESASAGLLAHAVGADFAMSDTTRQQCVALGAGNPLFLCTIAEHLRVRGTAPSADASVLDLLRQRVRVLDPRSLLLLRCVAALGNHGTQARLASCTGMATDAGLLALQDVADRGLVALRDGTTKCAHDLIGQVVLDDAPAAMRAAIFERAAAVLEEDGVAGKQINVLWSCAECWILANNRGRAATALRRCAEFALEIGQPVFALSALEKAQELSDERDLVGLVDETIRIADVACDYDAVLKNSAKYKALLHARGEALPRHHHSVLAEINAARRCGKPAWQHMDQLREYALDAEAPASHRLRAVRLFLISAVLNMNQAEGVALYAALGSLPPVTSDLFESASLSLLYHEGLGDLAQARRDAEQLVGLVRGFEEPARAMWLQSLGQSFYQIGDSDLALELLHESRQLSEKLGMLNNVMYSSCILTDIYTSRGDDENRSRFHARAEELFRIGGYGCEGFHLANGLDLALRQRDAESARRSLEALRSHPNHSPIDRRAFQAFDLLVAHLEGTLDPERIDFSELERVHALGRGLYPHDGFALALFVANMARGEPSKAVECMREYVHVWRRDRTPLWPYYSSVLSDSGLLEELRQAIGPVESGVAGAI